MPVMEFGGLPGFRNRIMKLVSIPFDHGNRGRVAAGMNLAGP